MAENKKTILVVDDVRANTILLKQMLAKSSYSVVTLDSGVSALDYLKNNPVDIVLLDIMMPIMNGYEVLSSIRNNPQTKDLPVVIVSALCGKEDIDKAMSKGASEYMTKPVDIDALMEIIDKYLC